MGGGGRGIPNRFEKHGFGANWMSAMVDMFLFEPTYRYLVQLGGVAT